jgi:hypothetical protein
MKLGFWRYGLVLRLHHTFTIQEYSWYWSQLISFAGRNPVWTRFRSYSKITKQLQKLKNSLKTG